MMGVRRPEQPVQVDRPDDRDRRRLRTRAPPPRLRSRARYGPSSGSPGWSLTTRWTRGSGRSNRPGQADRIVEAAVRSVPTSRRSRSAGRRARRRARPGRPRGRPARARRDRAEASRRRAPRPRGRRSPTSAGGAPIARRRRSDRAGAGRRAATRGCSRCASDRSGRAGRRPSARPPLVPPPASPGGGTRRPGAGRPVEAADQPADRARSRSPDWRAAVEPGRRPAPPSAGPRSTPNTMQRHRQTGRSDRPWPRSACPDPVGVVGRAHQPEDVGRQEPLRAGLDQPRPGLDRRRIDARSSIVTGSSRVPRRRSSIGSR